MGANTTSLALAIPELYWGYARSTLYLNDEFMRTMAALGMDVGAGIDQLSGEGDSYTWPVHYAGNDSVELFTEFQSQPTPGNQSYATAELSWIYAWGWASITERARDYLRAGQRFPALDREMTILVEQIRDLRNTTYLGTTNNGILHALNSTGTYAGIDRSTYTWWQSYVNAVTGALTAEELDTTELGQREPEKGGRLMANLTSPTQKDIYKRLPGYAGAANAAPRITINNQPGKAPALDLGVDDDLTTYNGRQIIGMPDFSTAYWCMLDFRAQNIKHRLIRPFGAAWHHNEGDASVYKISVGGTLIVEQPNWQAVATGLTT